jgi:hypothetical protein
MYNVLQTYFMYKSIWGHFIFNDDSLLIQLHILKVVGYLHFWFMLAAAWRPECIRRNMNFCSPPPPVPSDSYLCEQQICSRTLCLPLTSWIVTFWSIEDWLCNENWSNTCITFVGMFIYNSTAFIFGRLWIHSMHYFQKGQAIPWTTYI